MKKVTDYKVLKNGAGAFLFITPVFETEPFLPVFFYNEEDSLYLKRRPEAEPVLFSGIHPQAWDGLKHVVKILFVEVENESVRREFFAYKQGNKSL
jgi:hypothetical protein